MKGRWILLAICGGGAMGLGTLGVLSSALLSLWGYAWRPWLTTVGFLVIPPLLIAAVLTGASILITKSGENKEAGWCSKTMHWVGSTLVLCVGAALSWGMLQFGLLGFVFSIPRSMWCCATGRKCWRWSTAFWMLLSSIMLMKMRFSWANRP